MIIALLVCFVLYSAFRALAPLIPFAVLLMVFEIWVHTFYGASHP